MTRRCQQWRRRTPQSCLTDNRCRFPWLTGVFSVDVIYRYLPRLGRLSIYFAVVVNRVNGTNYWLTDLANMCEQFNQSVDSLSVEKNTKIINHFWASRGILVWRTGWARRNDKIYKHCKNVREYDTIIYQLPEKIDVIDSVKDNCRTSFIT